MKKFLRKWIRSELLFRYTFGLVLLVYAIGISVTVMEPDAATYAIISMEMLDRGNWIEITSRGVDWLDKPHFQFWVTAISYKIFGVNNLGFKFPAILFTLLGAFYTYRFAKHFYSARVGAFSVLILLSSLHLILSNNDVRAEPYLLGLTIFSLFYLARYLEDKKFQQLVFGTIGLACLMMTKGMFSIIPVATAIFFHLLVNQQWKEIFHWQWLLAGLLMLFFMIPTLYAYYQQFDLHPEKELFGQTGISGIKFFFWDSQWGRFTNTGPIKGAGDPFFFLHSILWAFAPWAILGYLGLYRRAKMLVRKRALPESYTFFGFVTVILIFSISKFQLPHYLVPLFPFLAIICADVLMSVSNEKSGFKILNGVHILTVGLFLSISILLQMIFGGEYPHWDTIFLGVIVVSIVLCIYVISANRIKRLVFPPALSLLLVMYYMNRDFYPKLMRYQSESEVAFFARHNGIDPDQIICFERNQWVTDFYLRRTLPRFEDAGLSDKVQSGKIVYTTYAGLELLRERNLSLEVLKVFPDFPVTTLTPEFVFKNTRESALETMFLVRIE